MVDYLIQATLSNLMVATVIAALAWAVQRRVRSASLANLLWALVLVKMLTPPLFNVPVVEVPSLAGTSKGQVESAVESNSISNAEVVKSISNFSALDSLEATTLETNAWPAATEDSGGQIATIAFVGWLSISVCLLLMSGLRIFRFHWLLKANSCLHTELSNGLSADVAEQFGLQKRPDVLVTTANVAPFVWWRAFRPVIVIPAKAARALGEKDLRMIIAHETAHIARYDHWFRWLEWVAMICFWWNPVMWWSRRQLRISEEMACDDLVLRKSKPDVTSYANSLLNMAEILVTPAIRPPVVASAINSGGSLENRLKMMIAENSCNVPSSLRLVVVAIAICVLPLGFVHAQDFEAVERRLGGAVEAGELTLSQAELMMESLRRSAGSEDREEQNERGTDRDAIIRRYVKGLEDAGIRRESIRPILGIAKRLSGQITEQGNSFELRDDTMEYLVNELQLTREQIGVVVRIAASMADLSELGDNEVDSYNGIMMKIRAAVERGELSAEEAEQKIVEMRRRLAENEDGDADREGVRIRRYMALEQRLKAAVERGEISEDEAEQKLIEMRMRMSGDEDRRKEGGGEEELRGVMRRLNGAVERGEISEEEAERKMIELRMRMSGDEDDRSEGGEGAELRGVMMRIKAAVERGELSEEEAEQKIIEMRKKMAADEGGDAEMDGRKRRYMAFEEKIKDAVRLGELSEDEAEQKLAELRQEMFGDDK